MRTFSPTCTRVAISKDSRKITVLLSLTEQAARWFPTVAEISLGYVMGGVSDKKREDKK
jgi:hypothetical protein